MLGAPLSEGQKLNVSSEILEETIAAREALMEGGEAAKEVAMTSAKRKQQAIDDVATAFRKGDVEAARAATIKLIYAARLDDVVANRPSEIDA